MAGANWYVAKRFPWARVCWTYRVVEFVGQMSGIESRTAMTGLCRRFLFAGMAYLLSFLHDVADLLTSGSFCSEADVPIFHCRYETSYTRRCPTSKWHFGKGLETGHISYERILHIMKSEGSIKATAASQIIKRGVLVKEDFMHP